jgi:hypothetical protein
MILLFRQPGDLFFLVAQPVMVGDLSAQEPEVRVRSAAVCEASAAAGKQVDGAWEPFTGCEMAWRAGAGLRPSRDPVCVLTRTSDPTLAGDRR